MTKERFEKMYARICGIQEKYNIPRTPENVKTVKIVGELLGIISRELDANNCSEDVDE